MARDDSKLLARAQMMQDPVFEGVETFCCQRRRDVTLDLCVGRRPLSSVVSGSPVSCSCEVGCSKGIFCLLKVNQITTGRRTNR